MKIDTHEPSWKNWIVYIPNYLTLEQCDEVINIGRSLKPQEALIGSIDKGQKNTKIRKTINTFIPVNKYPFISQHLIKDVHMVNRNNMGFKNITLIEDTQYAEYYSDGHYDWHMDSEIDGSNQGLIRKISLSILLNNPSEFEGGQLEFMTEGRSPPLKKGDAVFFASFIMHRVKPVTKGVRKSLVQWFSGTAFE
jgi:PKHD-type hydroxylase